MHVTKSDGAICPPFYEQMLCFGRYKPSRSVAVGLVTWSLWVYLLLLAASALFGSIHDPLQLGLVYYGGPLVVAAGFLLMSKSYRDACAAFPTILAMVEEDRRDYCTASFQAIFRSRYQYATCLLMALLGTGTAFLSKEAVPEALQTAPNVIWWIFLLCVFYAGFVLAPGLWFAASSLIWARNVLSCGLALNDVFPGRTEGLRELSRLMWNLSFRFTTEASLGMLVLFLIPWSASNTLVAWWLTFWPLVLVPFVLFYFCWPQVRIRRVIQAASNKVLDDLENRIASSLRIRHPATKADMESLQMYFSMFTDLEKRGTAIPYGATSGRIIATVFMPSALYVIQHYDEVYAALRTIGKYVK